MITGHVSVISWSSVFFFNDHVHDWQSRILYEVIQIETFTWSVILKSRTNFFYTISKWVDMFQFLINFKRFFQIPPMKIWLLLIRVTVVFTSFIDALLALGDTRRIWRIMISSWVSLRARRSSPDRCPERRFSYGRFVVPSTLIFIIFFKIIWLMSLTIILIDNTSRGEVLRFQVSVDRLFLWYQLYVYCSSHDFSDFLRLPLLQWFESCFSFLKHTTRLCDLLAIPLQFHFNIFVLFFKKFFTFFLDELIDLRRYDLDDEIPIIWISFSDTTSNCIFRIADYHQDPYKSFPRFVYECKILIRDTRW